MEAPTIFDGDTLNHAHQEELLQSRGDMAKKIKGDVRNEDPIILTHFDTIFGPANKAAMRTEEQNAEIREALSNDDFLPQELELRQALGKYSLVQPIGTA